MCIYFLLWLQHHGLKSIGRYEMTSCGVGDNSPVVFSICILLGFSLSVNFILGLSLGVHMLPVCSPHTIDSVTECQSFSCSLSSDLVFKLLFPTHQYKGCLGPHTVCLKTYL